MFLVLWVGVWNVCEDWVGIICLGYNKKRRRLRKRSSPFFGDSGLSYLEASSEILRNSFIAFSSSSELLRARTPADLLLFSN